MALLTDGWKLDETAGIFVYIHNLFACTHDNYHYELACRQVLQEACVRVFEECLITASRSVKNKCYGLLTFNVCIAETNQNIAIDLVNINGGWYLCNSLVIRRDPGYVERILSAESVSFADTDFLCQMTHDELLLMINNKAF